MKKTVIIGIIAFLLLGGITFYYLRVARRKNQSSTTSAQLAVASPTAGAALVTALSNTGIGSVDSVTKQIESAAAINLKPQEAPVPTPIGTATIDQVDLTARKNSAAITITEFYSKYLGRQPDSITLTNLVQSHIDGKSLAAIEQEISSLPEASRYTFIKQHGGFITNSGHSVYLDRTKQTPFGFQVFVNGSPNGQLVQLYNAGGDAYGYSNLAEAFALDGQGNWRSIPYDDYYAVVDKTQGGVLIGTDQQGYRVHIASFPAAGWENYGRQVYVSGAKNGALTSAKLVNGKFYGINAHNNKYMLQNGGWVHITEAQYSSATLGLGTTQLTSNLRDSILGTSA